MTDTIESLQARVAALEAASDAEQDWAYELYVHLSDHVRQEGDDVIKPYCNRCNQELISSGALLFSTPDEYGHVMKFHLCSPCFSQVVVMTGIHAHVNTVNGKSVGVNQ